MRSLLPFAAVGLLAGCLLVLPPAADPAQGCAPAFRPGERVEIASESAIIVWDEAAKTEHFIRRARFTGNTSADFGFLVPTPSVPELAEATDMTFSTLETFTAPRIEVRRNEIVESQFGCFGMPKSSAPNDAASAIPPAAGGVEVLKKQRVGQFDAAILKAEDPQKLREWLEKNGYQARPELTAWLKAYTDNKWIITAYKIAAQTGNTPASTVKNVDASAVRMTFKADKPFYPYREPEDARSPTVSVGNRHLKVFFVADKRYTGTLGKDGVWPGYAVWANAIAGDVVGPAIGGKAEPSRSWWLTEFEDRASPRPGTDEVYFAPSADQSTLERPPIIHMLNVYVVKAWPDARTIAVASVLIPIGAIALVYLLWRLIRRPQIAK